MQAKKKIGSDPRIPSSLSVEGAQTEDWMVVDLGRYMLHIFSPESRKAYDIDGLWTLIRDPMLGLGNEAKAQRVIESFKAFEPPSKHIKDLEEKDIPTEDVVMGLPGKVET
jgi:hypothetical protein